MEKVKDKIFKFLGLEHLIDNISGYVETRLDLYKMEIREDVAKVLSKGLVYVMLLLLAVLFLVFFSIGLAYYLNRFFTDTFAGFWIVSGLYGLVFLIFLVFRKNIDRNFEKYFTEMIKSKPK